MRKVSVALAAALVLALTVIVSASADDFSKGNGAKAAPNWKVYNLSSSGQTYTTKPSQSFGDGIGFDFGSTPDTRLFLTSQGSSSLLGNLTGKTLSATFTISGTSTAFTYYGEGQPWNPCGTPASARLYFEGDTNGPFAETKYWWANPSSAELANRTVTLTVPLTGSQWSDFYGHFGNDPAYAAGFASAVGRVGAVGLSFGGGCFFANGVSPTNGTASFVLSSYTVTP